MVKEFQAIKDSQALAKRLAPEDITRGQYVAVLFRSEQFTIGGMCGEPLRQVRFRELPMCPSTPMKVKAVCLPFVLVKSPAQEVTTIDVRVEELALLDKDYARLAFRLLGPKKSGGNGQTRAK